MKHSLFRHYSANKLSGDWSSNNQAGFSLVEMAVVATIIGILSTSIITSFSRNRIDIDQNSNLLMSTLRDAQTRAIASRVYSGYNPCGYGIHYISSTQIAIYVGPDANTTDCSSINKNYSAGEDTLILYQSFGDSRIHIKSSFDDIFFQPPDPKTYINNDSSLNQAPASIQVGVIGTACPQDCKTIYIYPSGKIEI